MIEAVKGCVLDLQPGSSNHPVLRGAANNRQGSQWHHHTGVTDSNTLPNHNQGWAGL
jgi:hypothetical protein